MEKKSRGNSELYVVEEDLEELERKIRRHKIKFWRRIFIGVICVAAVFTGVHFFLKYQTYGSAHVIERFENKNIDNGSYMEFADNILKYSKDGVSLLNKRGEEIWNQPYQMQNPMVETCRGTLVIGDEGGTSMFVLQKDGTKGEIQTTRPIEKITVSEQGIVGAVLKDESTPWVVCYDAKGNLLVEHKASLVNTGYPVDIALSNDGNMLLVSYIYMKGSSVATRIVYYDFGETGQKKKDHQAAVAEYENAIMPTVFFADNQTSVIVGDNALLFYGRGKEPKLSGKIEMKKEIKSVVHDEKYIALVLKNSGNADSELRLYNMKGKQIMSVNFEGEYNNIKITKDQIILFDGNKCSIYNKAGVHKYEGKLGTNIMDMIPITGLNKYLVISVNELQEVQLAK